MAWLKITSPQFLYRKISKGFKHNAVDYIFNKIELEQLVSGNIFSSEATI